MNKDIDSLVLICNSLHKSYVSADTLLPILQGINLEVGLGETVSIVGSSGSGKSTLLHVLAGLDRPTSGEIILDGHVLSGLNDDQVCALRNKKLGFIYQFHHLLPEFTAYENVVMPLLIGGNVSPGNKDFARHILERLGLAKRLLHYPAQLSGGERQRVAIARAVINNPKLIFADEPTGNLDNHTGSQVLEIFFELQKELKTSLVIVTHDPAIAALTKYRYRLKEGSLYSE
ncbi:MAG: lipoprotein-releasing system ATP-binding protein LolD [Burkholderiales bacterium]|jgi:lipoprotein-releasing system ATP-binding protein|nr:lipoprotein-releasing system ATP-binding protein LolD [Burkholderiales bacterium]